MYNIIQASGILHSDSQFLKAISRSVVSDFLWPHGQQHTRPPCPSLLEVAQTHVHWVGDPIQPSHLLSSLSFPDLNLSQHPIRVFSNESVLHIKRPKIWSFTFSTSPSVEYSGLVSFRMDWFDLLAVQGTLKSLLQHHSSKTNSSTLSFLYGPTLTSIHDYWKNHRWFEQQKFIS